MSVSPSSLIHSAHINIVSLSKNLDKLNLFISQLSKKMDIVCISETRLKDHKIKYVQLPGYDFFFHNSDKAAGGAAIYVNKSLQANEIYSLKQMLGTPRMFGLK